MRGAADEESRKYISNALQTVYVALVLHDKRSAAKNFGSRSCMQIAECPFDPSTFLLFFPPRCSYGNLNVSLFKGRVYFYDVCTELLRVLAVQKARARGEDRGVFFQSRAAVAKLNAMDPVLFKKLKNRW